MAQGRTIVEQDQTTAEDAIELDAGFGAEFRELARQRRFVRSSQEPADRDASGNRDADGSDWRVRAAAPRKQHPQPHAKPVPPKQPAMPANRAVAPLPPTSTLRRAATDPRISDDQRATLRELARMSDRLVESREQLVAISTRAQHLEAELVAARTELHAGEQRLIASRVLVQDAQRSAHAMAERCAWLESRCETLQDALELAVNASWLARWRWRREHRART